MPESTKPIPGTFCWAELYTPNVEAAKNFYTGLFGWTTTEMAQPGASAYTIYQLAGRHVSGMKLLEGRPKEMGAPPHWLSYIAVDDCAATVDKIRTSKGNVLFGPFNAGQGTMAIIQDPAGAVFGLWQQHQSMGAWLYNEPGALCWNELMTTNVDIAGKFYTTIFGWRAEAHTQMGPVYTIFKNGETQAGGMMAIPAEMKGVPSHWGVYYAVNDADAIAAQATRLGAKVLRAPMDIPNVGRFAVFQDPQGAAFAVIKLIPQK